MVMAVKLNGGFDMVVLRNVMFCGSGGTLETSYGNRGIPKRFNGGNERLKKLRETEPKDIYVQEEKNLVAISSQYQIVQLQ